jgi:predicted TIM-barrel fold metal-dependent hydrolase
MSTTTGSADLAPAADVEHIRASIDHPIVDGDGHMLEYMPLVFERLRELAGQAAVDRLAARTLRGGLPGGPEARFFWGTPAANTLDRMTATLPALMHSRLDQLGIDFAIVYPTEGLIAATLYDAEVRQAACRALNLYYAEAYAPFRDRLSPVAVVPTFTPAEAISELEHAVSTLGLRSVVMEGVVPRLGSPHGHTDLWMDTLGHASAYDYDPLWARCVELGVSPAFHASAIRWGSRTSTTNYVYNHVGAFAAAQEATCRSLVMGGVPRRFPALRFQFLEGGVAWAAQLLADLVGHFEKRNHEAVEQYNPARFDLPLAEELLRAFGSDSFVRHSGHYTEHARRWMASDVAETDDFAASLIRSSDDILDMFSKQFFFGCEADDPLNALAFDCELLGSPMPLNAMFGSDIGHWDVPDMQRVLPEAWELVEAGHIGLEAFRSFTFDNVVRAVAETNPHFFDGTSVPADRVAALRGEPATGSVGRGRSA